MENPFTVINERLNNIEKLLTNLKPSETKEVLTDSKSDLVKIETAAEITGYKKGYIYELVSKNEIPHIKRGRSIRFSRCELDSWMRAGRPSIINETLKNLQKA